ncbi:Cell division protein FtsQ [compost metagenome]
MDNGIVVKLPQDGLGEALALLSRLDSEQQILSRDIASIDLRLRDRTTVQLTADAHARRQAAVDARAKALKKAEQNI